MTQRIIKFRAFENGQMYYQVQAGGFLGTVPVIFVEKDGVSQWVNSTGENPVMQFTGLEDRNGKEIFEGDIVLNKDGSLVAEISFRPDYGWVGNWRYKNPKKEERKDVFCVGSIAEHKFESAKGGWYFQTSIEIIGNIYENPDLLTKGVKA